MICRSAKVKHIVFSTSSPSRLRHRRLHHRHVGILPAGHQGRFHHLYHPYRSIEFALLWNHLRMHLFARIWFSVDAAVFLTVHTVQLGTVSGWHFFLRVCVFLLFYMFPRERRSGCLG